MDARFLAVCRWLLWSPMHGVEGYRDAIRWTIDNNRRRRWQGFDDAVLATPRMHVIKRRASNQLLQIVFITLQLLCLGVISLAQRVEDLWWYNCLLQAAVAIDRQVNVRKVVASMGWSSQCGPSARRHYLGVLRRDRRAGRHRAFLCWLRRPNFSGEAEHPMCVAIPGAGPLFVCLYCFLGMRPCNGRRLHDSARARRQHWLAPRRWATWLGHGGLPRAEVPELVCRHSAPAKHINGTAAAEATRRRSSLERYKALHHRCYVPARQCPQGTAALREWRRHLSIYGPVLCRPLSSSRSGRHRLRGAAGTSGGLAAGVASTAMSQGAHFLSDVIFAGVFMALTVLAVHNASCWAIRARRYRAVAHPCSPVDRVCSSNNATVSTTTRAS